MLQLALLTVRVCEGVSHLMLIAKHLKPFGKLYMGEITALVLNTGCAGRERSDASARGPAITDLMGSADPPCRGLSTHQVRIAPLEVADRADPGCIQHHQNSATFVADYSKWER